MMYCQKCGTPLQSAVKFCPNCGCADPSDSQFRQSPTPQQTIPVQSWPSQTAKAEFCEKCGAPMAPNTTFCRKCGYSRPVPAMKEKKFAWWKIAVPAVLVLVLVVVLFCTPIMLHIAPNLALINAFDNTTDALVDRIKGTPMELIADAYGKKQVTTEFKMDYRYNSADMEMVAAVQTDSSERKAQVDLDVSIGNGNGENYNVNGQLYFDKEYMALNLNPFTDDDFYGLAYDSFSDDLEDNDYLSDNLGSKTVDMLEKAVEIWSDVLNGETEEMALTGEYGETIKAFLNEHKPEVGTASVSLDGKDRSCNTLTYDFTAEDLGDLLEGLTDMLQDEDVLEDLMDTLDEEMFTEFIDELQSVAEELQDTDSDITLYCCLYRNRIAYASFYADTDGYEEEICLNLGTDPSKSDISITVENDYSSIEMTLSREISGKVITETLETYEKYSFNKAEGTFGYEWDSKNGDLVFFGDYKDNYDKQDFELEMTLIKENGGFSLEIPDFVEWVIDLEDANRSSYSGIDLSFGLYVSEGVDITPPNEYINIREIDEDVVEEFMKIAEEEFS